MDVSRTSLDQSGFASTASSANTNEYGDVSRISLDYTNIVPDQNDVYAVGNVAAT
jgi:hypothetical protein